MKIITQIEAVLDLKTILGMSGVTITRHITLFVGADNKHLPAIMQAARDARDLLRNDADMTMRLIGVRPEKEQEYKQAWATAAEKQLMNVFSLISVAFVAEKRPLHFSPADEPIMTPDEINDWITPAPKQAEHPGEPLIPDEIPTKETAKALVKPAPEELQPETKEDVVYDAEEEEEEEELDPAL